MAELIINIAAEKEPLIAELVKQLGGSVIENKPEKRKNSKRKKNSKPVAKKVNTINNNKKKRKPVDHTYLFGKWKDFDIDARKLREEVWKRY